MMKNPVTASERRGILVVAALALAVTGCGFLMSLCNRGVPEVPPPEVEVLVRGDSVQGKDSRGKSGKRRKRNSKKDSVGNAGNKAPKKYRRRNPLDEGV